MANDYHHNHYVPIWYQKRFVPKNINQYEIYYLDLQPHLYKDKKGKIRQIFYEPKKRGYNCCFAENDLYTRKFGLSESTVVEKEFFGEIDVQGRFAVEYFSNFSHQSASEASFHGLIRYLSTQKLRTPKGLGWLSSIIGSSDKNTIINGMAYHRDLFCSIWTECIWQIADADNSQTKFIVSDHPVTIYNRACVKHPIYDDRCLRVVSHKRLEQL